MIQPPIPGTEQPPKLTDRQECALELIREHGPMLARELGRRMREIRGVGSPAYDDANGLAIAKELRRKGVVRLRVKKPSGWYACDERGKPLRRASAEQGEGIPF